MDIFSGGNRTVVFSALWARVTSWLLTPGWVLRSPLSPVPVLTPTSSQHQTTLVTSSSAETLMGHHGASPDHLLFCSPSSYPGSGFCQPASGPEQFIFFNNQDKTIIISSADGSPGHWGCQDAGWCLRCHHSPEREVLQQLVYSWRLDCLNKAGWAPQNVSSIL